ncbi:gibberellin 20 oxidase 2-like [Phragmites australis]|uniref:gibberellin 20 oxidase 2-like n=1 Tax=Phragmites australis TaxID=29695 RepID=UPI002D76C6C7|nr:gibberellin 20 oxidase 2-like [Phragmites australis]
MPQKSIQPHHSSSSRDHHLVGMEVGRCTRALLPVSPADEADGKNGDVVDLWHQPKIPDSFVWPRADALPSSERDLDATVVDVGAAMRSDAGLRRAVEQVAAACASHGLFQVTGHGVDPALARVALDGAAEFFRLPLATKQHARRIPGDVAGYTTAHVDRFSAKLPWKETLSFGHRDSVTAGSHVVMDYFTSTLGSDFKPLGQVYQDYCEAMKEVSLAIMEVLGLSLGVARSYYRDFFADGRSIMRCNYYPPCPEPERTLGTGPHCDPAALTLLLQDGDVDGLQVFVHGEWRPVRPKPGALVVSTGDTFMALSNGRYRSCLHRAVVHRERERRTLAFFLCPRDDRVVRPPPPHLAEQPRRYPDFTWADLARFTQRHYRADDRTLDAFARWFGPSPS